MPPLKTQLSTSHQTLLDFQRVTYQTASTTLLRQVSFSVKREQILTVIGPNGAGKTTLVRLALHLIRPSQGHVWMRPKIQIGYMPQRLTLNDTLPITVEKFLYLNYGVSSVDLRVMMQDLKIQALKNKLIHHLSGGEFQRVLLAQALLCRPDFLVLDEPAQRADVHGQAFIYSYLRHYRRQHHCGILLISHDLNLVMAASDKVICLNQHICCSGTPEAVQKHQYFKDLISPNLSKEMAFYRHEHNHTHDQLPVEEDRNR